MKTMIIAILIYLLLINLIAFSLMFIDKRRAIKHKWRISEAALIGICALGGSIGGYIGMQVFRHKTKHVKFYIGVPAIIIIQFALIFYITFIY